MKHSHIVPSGRLFRTLIAAAAVGSLVAAPVQTFASSDTYVSDDYTDTTYMSDDYTDTTYTSDDYTDPSSVGTVTLDLGTMNQTYTDDSQYPSTYTDTTVFNGSPDVLSQQLSDAGFYVQTGSIKELDSLRLASDGMLLTCLGNDAGSTYLYVNLPPAPDQDAAEGDEDRGWSSEPSSAYDDPTVANYAANPYLSPAGIQFKLRQDEAVVVVAPLPDLCEYWSFTAYDMFTAQIEGKDYSREKDFFGIGDETTGLYHKVFSSIGSPVNMLNANHSGDSAFGNMAVLVLCANSQVRDTISQCLTAAGYPDSMVNVMEIPSSVYRVGLERGKDTFSLLGCISQPDNTDLFNTYMAGLSVNAAVFRVTPQETYAASELAVQPLTVRGSGYHEASRLINCTEQLDAIRDALIEEYSEEYDYEELSTSIAYPSGMSAYINGDNAQGDLPDSAYLMTGDFELNSDEDFVVFYGVNHVSTGKAHYFSASLHERPMMNGVCTINDTYLMGSANSFMEETLAEASNYYVFKMARAKIDEYTALIPYSTDNLQGRYYGVDNDSPIYALFNICLDETTGTGPSYSELVFDRAIVFHKIDVE